MVSSTKSRNSKHWTATFPFPLLSNGCHTVLAKIPIKNKMKHEDKLNNSLEQRPSWDVTSWTGRLDDTELIQNFQLQFYGGCLHDGDNTPLATETPHLSWWQWHIPPKAVIVWWFYLRRWHNSPLLTIKLRMSWRGWHYQPFAAVLLDFLATVTRLVAKECSAVTLSCRQNSWNLETPSPTNFLCQCYTCI
jgi:hypothetical protein